MDSEPPQAHPNVLQRALGYPSVFDDISVLKNILHFVPTNSRTHQPYLLSVALTCKSFSEPALDALWHSLSSVIPLLKLLSPLKRVNGFYVFQGPFDANDWLRFDTYSRRVKNLSVTASCTNVAPSTYIRLAQLQPIVFPALEELIFFPTLEDDTSLLLFLSPTLKSIEISGNRAVYDKLISPALSTIAYGFGNTNLTHLTLCGDPPTHVPGLLKQFSNLQYLNVSGTFDARNLKEVGELVNLEEMVIQLPESLSLQGRGFGFEKLRILHITSSFPSLLFVLEQMATTSLESIVVTATPTILQIKPAPAPVPAPVAPPRKKLSKMEETKVKVENPTLPEPQFEALNNWQEVVKVLNSRWSLTLQSIIIIQDKSPNAVVKPTPPKLFANLPPFQCLEHLEIRRCTFFPCDEGIRLLALACPNLRTLYLPLVCVAAHTGKAYPKAFDYQPPLSETSTTIVALWSLCDLCCRLEDLQIGLDVTDIPPFLNTTIRSHNLAQLSISSHHTTEAGQSHLLNIARHIDRLFPCLEVITSHSRYGSVIWSEVKRIISVYKLVRLDDGIRRLPKEEVSVGA